MAIDPDIRWKQRLNNYGKACAQVDDALILARSRPLSQLEQQGLIQAFEFTFELAWNLMKDYLFWQGIPDVSGARDAIRNAFKLGLLADGECWMDMIASRNQTVHAYNQAVANAIAQKITDQFQPQFTALLSRMRLEAARS